MPLILVVHLPFASIVKLGRGGEHRRLLEAGVDSDGRAPGGGQGLLHATRRQGFHKRRCVADEKRAALEGPHAIVQRRVAGPRLADLPGAGETCADADGLAELLAVEARETGLSHGRAIGVDHHGALAPGLGDRNGPGPAVAVTIDKGMGTFISRPSFAFPLCSDGERSIAGVRATQPSSGDDTRATRTIEDEAAATGAHSRRADALDGCRISQLDAPHMSFDHRRTLCAGVVAQQPIEERAWHVIAGGGRRGHGLFAGPAGDVAVVWMKARGVDEILQPEKSKQLACARRQRLGEARRLRRAVHDDDRSAPRREQRGGRGAGRTAADDDDVNVRGVRGVLHHASRPRGSPGARAARHPARLPALGRETPWRSPRQS